MFRLFAKKYIESFFLRNYVIVIQNCFEWLLLLFFFSFPFFSVPCKDIVASFRCFAVSSFLPHCSLRRRRSPNRWSWRYRYPIHLESHPKRLWEDRDLQHLEVGCSGPPIRSQLCALASRVTWKNQNVFFYNFQIVKNLFQVYVFTFFVFTFFVSTCNDATVGI